MNRGLQVDVIHLMGWLMETQLDPMSGQFLQQSLEELGVTFHLEKLTTAVMGDGKVTGPAVQGWRNAGLAIWSLFPQACGLTWTWPAWPACTCGGASW